jgi:hypothetical protein
MCTSRIFEGRVVRNIRGGLNLAVYSFLCIEPFVGSPGRKSSRLHRNNEGSDPPDICGETATECGLNAFEDRASIACIADTRMFADHVPIGRARCARATSQCHIRGTDPGQLHVIPWRQVERQSSHYSPTGGSSAALSHRRLGGAAAGDEAYVGPIGKVARSNFRRTC